MQAFVRVLGLVSIALDDLGFSVPATLLLPIHKLLKRNIVQTMQDLVVHEEMRDIIIFVPYLFVTIIVTY